MGNVLDVVKGRSDNSDEEDLEYLCTQNSAIFNDGYLSEIFERLPEFDGTSMSEEKGDCKRNFSAMDIKIRRLVQIFSTQEKKITRVEDFASLSSYEELENSPFTFNNKMRSRLLQRIHLAYLRQVQRAHASDNGDESASGRMSLAEGNGGASIVGQALHESGDAILTAASIRMSLAILQCLGPANPTLFPTFSASILDLLAGCSSLALCCIEDRSPHADALRAITAFATETALKDKGNRRDALSLMLAVAVTSGSLHELLGVVVQLLEGPEAMPAASRLFLARLAEKESPLLLSRPEPETVIGEFTVKTNLDVEKGAVDVYENEFCVDGSYLYVWHGLDGSLRKVGTGFHGTIAGNEYMVNSNVLQQLKDRLGPMVFEVSQAGGGESELQGLFSNYTGPDGVVPTPARRVTITSDHAVIFDIGDNGPGEQDTLQEVLAEEWDTSDGESTSLLSTEVGTEYEVLEELEVEVNGSNVVFYRVGAFDWLPMSVGVHMPGADESDNSDCCSDEESNTADSYTTMLDVAVVLDVVGQADSGSVAAGRMQPGSTAGDRGAPGSPVFHQGWLACVNGKLYLRLMSILGPFRVAVFSCTAVKLEDILEINLPIPVFVKARTNWLQLKHKELLEMSPDGASAGNNGARVEECLERLQVELAACSGDNTGSNSDEVGDGDEFEYSSEEVNLLDLRAFPDTAPVASVVMASSNFSSGGAAERNILAADSSWSPDHPFVFDGEDEAQELTVDLGEQLRVSAIGSSFALEGDNAVEGSFTVLVSLDGSNYVEFGVVERANFSSEEPTQVRHPAEGAEDGIEDENIVPRDIRFIRLNFGRHPSSGKGSSVSRIEVRGRRKNKVEHRPPFLAMTSDGHHLLFLQYLAAVDGADPARKEHRLRSYLVDPVGALSVHWQKEFAWGGIESEAQLHKCSFIFNSSLLFVSHPKDFTKRMKNKKELSYSFHRLDCASGKRTASADAVFIANSGIPAAVTYDSRNNMIWGWDAENLRATRWRNVGLPPSFVGATLPSSSSADMLLSAHPQHRIEALKQDPAHLTNPRVEAALILSQLDRLSLPFSPPSLPRAESKALNEIEVCSAGFEDGNFARILVRGQHCAKCSRGFNVLTLDAQLQPKDFRNFDTHGAPEASERLADFIDTVPEGTVVLAAVMDSAQQHFTSRGKAAMSIIGAKNIEKLTHRGSFAIIGRKGGDAGEAKQKMTSKRHGEAMVRQRIPTAKAPLCYECEPSTIHILVTLVDKYHGVFRGDAASTTDKVILISSMRLLMTNIFQLLEGMPVSEALKVFSAQDRAVAVRIVSDLVEHPSPCQGGALISEVALRLFVTSIDILYPTSGEKCALLLGYLDAFVNDSISDLGRGVLELLLRQMSVPESLVKLFYGPVSQEKSSTSPSELIESLMSIAKKDTLLRLEKVVDATSSTQSTSTLLATSGAASVGEASVQMLSILCNMILSQAAQTVVTYAPPSGEDAGTGAIEAAVELERAIDVILSLLATFTEASTSILQSGKSANDKLVAAHAQKSDCDSSSLMQMDAAAALDDEIDMIFKHSPVGVLLPTVLSTLALLFDSHGQKIISQVLPYAIDTKLEFCLRAVKVVLDCIPQEKLQPRGTSEHSSTRTSVHVYESEHPYQSNVDESTELNFPNAIRMTFTFDEQTRTEHNYDWLKIWKDSTKTEVLHVGVEKYSGRNGSENWPGFGGRAPLVVDGGQACLEFHSDSSNEDWGYRVHVQVEYKRKAEARIHWLVELEHQMVHCGAVIAASMIVSTPWGGEMEERNASWMENSLLKAGFRDEESDDLESLSDKDDAEMTFLRDFVERPPGSLAARFCKTMKMKVIEDKGQVDEVNRAVYATCAALLLHKHVVAEAMAVADGSEEPSESLLRIWKVGQKMRTFFDFGDLKNASPTALTDDMDDLPPPPAMERGPSIYSGAETLVIEAAAERVITRAQFLLRVNSAAKTAELAKESADRSAKSPPKTAFQLPFSTQTGGWDALVGELQSAYKLKGMLEYRRSALNKVKHTHLTTSEKVLRFVQGFAVVEELEAMRAVRNTRACIRAQGVDMMSVLVDAATTPFSVRWLMLSFSRAMRATCHGNRPQSHVHFLNSIEGCSQKERGSVISSFCGFVQKCVFMMHKSYELSHNEHLLAQLRDKWRMVTVSSLGALAIDYDLLDHSILDKCDVLAAVQFFLQARDSGTGDSDVYRTALSLFELLLPRCVGLEGQVSGLHSEHEPSELSKKLVALLVSELDRASQMVTIRRNPLMENSLATSLGAVNLLSQTVQLRRDCMGYTAPHIDMGLKHSVSFWFKRQRRAVDTLFEASEPLTADQLVGHSVVQGPDWDPLRLDNGGEEGIGTIMSFDEDSRIMKVKWTSNKITGNYKFGKTEQDVQKFEVVLADPDINGHVYSKGMRALLSEDDRAFVWSTFGLQLTADARLMMFAARDEDGNFRAKSSSRVPPEVWTHVSVVQDFKATRLYINGELDSEKIVVPCMLYPIKGVKEKEVVESPHPYQNNTNSFTEVAVEGAISYTITFDQRTRTEQSHDYIRFYKDANHSDYWGCDKYSGGRAGSRSNWPGVADNPPLVIPAAKFVVHFKSDGSNNDWGYRITCIAEKNNVYNDSKPMIQVLNTMPFYIGQTPTYVDNLPSTPAATGFIADLNVFGNKALTREEVRQVMSVMPPSPEHGEEDELACLDVLGIMTKSRLSLTGFAASLLNSTFVGPNILYPLFNILANGTGHAQISSVRVCASLLCAYPVHMIDEQARRVGLVHNDSFLGYLFNRVGSVKNAYYSRNADVSPDSLKARFCNELKFAIGLEYLTLLNALVTSELWVGVISATIEEVLQNTAPRVLRQISEHSAQETARGCSSAYLGVDSSDLNMLLVVLGLCGGGLTGLYMGSKARCTVGDDNGIIEDCTILNAAWPPSKDELEAMTKENKLTKSDVDMWKDKTCFTDAFYVVLKSQPTKPLLVPRDKVNIEKCSVAPALSSLVNKYSSEFVALFEALAAINCADLRPKHLPRVVATDEVQEFESEHPHWSDSKKTVAIEFSGASSMSLSFDRRTRTEPGAAAVTFFKDESTSDYWGEAEYSGRDANQNWPGLNGRKPLVIPSDKCVLQFKSEGASSDWGYKVIARAHCVVKTYPPERPPLLHNAIAGHIKLLGMTALHALLKEFSWFSLHCMPILGPLVASALAPLPELKLGIARVKPIVLESKHPYDHNMDEYVTVRMSGAKKLKVIFDEETCTENGADYLRLYKDDSHMEYWGDNQYTGGKDGGSSNWPGMQGREPLIIPANSFVAYFKTDGSVNAWGYKMYVTAVVDDTDTVPNMDSTLCSFRAHCNHMVIRDCRLSQPEPEGLDLFETEPVVAPLSLGTSGGSLPSEATIALAASVNNASSLHVHAKTHFNKWPRNFCINGCDALVIAVHAEPDASSAVLFLAGGSSVFSTDRQQGDWLHVTSSMIDVVMIDVTPLYEQLGGELPNDIDEYVSQETPGAPARPKETSGWILRRQGDLVFVVSENASPASSSSSSAAHPDWVNLDDILTSGLDSDEGGGAPSRRDKHPMYDVDESTLADVYGTNHMQPTPVEVLQSETLSPERSAVEMCQLGAIALSQDCISEILSLWPKDIPFSLGCFGSIDGLMQYVRAAYMRDTTAGKTTGSKGSRLDALKHHILAAIRLDETPASSTSMVSAGVSMSPAVSLCDNLMTFAITELSKSMQNEKALRPTMGKLFVVESKHPYDDNMDECWDVHVPGASSLRIVFDGRSSTEKDCDFVSICNDRNKTVVYGQRFTGRKKSSDKVWAGLGSVQALVVPGDKCVVHFHSDSSNTDWGFKLKCYGVMEEPSEEERDQLKEQRMAPDRPFADLACWMLEFLAKEPFAGVYRTLYAADTIATLRRYVEVMPARKKCFAIHLLTNMLQELPRVPYGPRVYDEVCLLKGVVGTLSSTQYSVERGGSTSQLLQALIQAAIVLDSCLTFMAGVEKNAKGSGFGTGDTDEDAVLRCGSDAVDGSMSIEMRWSSQLPSSSVIVSEDGSSVSCLASAEMVAGGLVSVVSVHGFPRRGVHASYIEVSPSAQESPHGAGMEVGFIVPFSEIPSPIRISLDAAGRLVVLVGDQDKANIAHFGCTMRPGDVICVELDWEAKMVSYYCNQAFVGVAVGPVGSGAACELDLEAAVQDRPLHLFALLYPGDAGRLVSPPSPLASNLTSAALESEWPTWFSPIREAVTLLKSCYARELPTAVLMRDFLPACQNDWSQVLQSPHPFTGQYMLEKVHIPHADELTVRFHGSSSMGENDVIVISAEGGSEDGFKHEYTQLTAGSHSADAVLDAVNVGDKVVRGPSWDWGDQDGGPGALGEVTELTTWKGKHNAGVTVKWERNDDFVGLYRWGFEGLFDLLVVERSENSWKALVVPGDTLTLEVLPGATKAGTATEAADVLWSGAPYFNGRSSFLQPPMFNAFDMSGDLTVEAWVKVATNIPSSTCCLPLFSRQIEVDCKITQFSLQLGTVDGDSDTTVLVMEAVNTQMQQSFLLRGGVVTPGVWTHVCGVVDGSVTALLVNGALVATSNSFTGTRLGALDAPLFIGKSADNLFFKGNMFDIRIWSQGRSVLEVKEAKDTPMSGSTASLLPELVSALGCAEEDIIAGGQEGMMNDAVWENGPSQLCDVMWDRAVEPHILPKDAHFGFQCTVTPTFSLKTLLSEPAFANKLMRLQCQYTVGELRHDVALVRYINAVSRTRKMKIDQLLRCEWADIAPTDDEVTALPLLKELMNMSVDAAVAHLQTKNAAFAGSSASPSKFCGSAGKKEAREEIYEGGGEEETKGPTLEEHREDNSANLPQDENSAVEIKQTDATSDVGRVAIPPEEECIADVEFLPPIIARFNVLKQLNKALSETLQYIDLCMADKAWSVAHLLTLCRGLVFEVTKAPVWEAALDATSCSSSTKFDMRLSRSRAAKHKRTGLPDDEARWMVFSQAFRQMHTLPPSTLRRTEQLFYTTFAGERAHDAGGPYREAFAMMYLELQSPSLPLLIRTPNGRHSVGQNREKWILNPSAKSSLHMDMFSFLGKLMGIAIRSKEYMEMNIPSIIWKLLVQETPGRDDLEAIDLFQIQSLDNMRNIHLQGITRESFAVTFYETFTTLSSDDRVVDLVTGGESKNVDFDNRLQYCDLIEQYRLHEFDAQAAAIRRGLASLIPLRLLSLYTWDQLEVMVCGSPTIDIKLLRSVTEYSSCSSTDTHIQFFWQILEDFSEEERSNFLRFVWGRSRLPLSAEGFSQRFKLQSFGKQPADQYLPVAHTCFFSLEFPSYSSLEVAREKLRYAIFNCQAIDGDDTSVGMQAAALGWEE